MDGSTAVSTVAEDTIREPTMAFELALTASNAKGDTPAVSPRSAGNYRSMSLHQLTSVRRYHPGGVKYSIRGMSAVVCEGDSWVIPLDTRQHGFPARTPEIQASVPRLWRFTAPTERVARSTSIRRSASRSGRVRAATAAQMNRVTDWCDPLRRFQAWEHSGPPESSGKAHKSAKITRSCDYRCREGRINKRLRIRVE